MNGAVSNTCDRLAARVASAGVVGAGGGAFPAANKLTARRYRRLIVNAAQSEPLLAKDWAALHSAPDCILGGAARLAEALDLGRAVLAVRDEFLACLPGLAARAHHFGVSVARLPDLYPLGYEKWLVREVLGVPVGDPRAESTLVLNAETVRNIDWAVRLDRPLCTKLLTVAGCVRRPISLSVPIGTPFADCLALAGGQTNTHVVVTRNGVLGGGTVDPAASWVDAATIGYVLLPADHSAAPARAAEDARLSKRRQEFLAATVAARPQAMSAAYALFDLTSFHRPRPEFLPVRSTDSTPSRVRLVPLGGKGGLDPCVTAGERVRRGQLVAVQPGAGGLRLHASMDGRIEEATSEGIAIAREARRGDA